MNKEKQNIVVLATGAATIVAALYFWSQRGNQQTQTPPSVEPAVVSNDTSAIAIQKPTAPNVQPTPKPEKPLPLLGPHLRKIGDCLQVKNSLNDEADLSFTSIVDSMRGELGELLADQTDWKNVHITLPNGDKRRLRIEVEAMGEEGSGLRLSYFGVDKDDLPIPIPLTDEQSNRPSEEYITSIENQGKVTLREEARRGVFSKGAEIYHVERNGFLTDLEITYEGKGVKCEYLQSNQGICNCF